MNHDRYIVEPLFRSNLTKKLTCDACQKDSPEDTSYEIKIRANSNGLAMIQDLCHNCFLKTIESLGLQKVWKKWDTNSKRWSIVDGPK